MLIEAPVSCGSRPDDGPTIQVNRVAGVNTTTAPQLDSIFPKHFTILKTVGQGGVGCVYLAYDETMGRRVAIKKLRKDFRADDAADREVIDSFIHEAKITGKLEHPGIVSIYEMGRCNDGQPYYVMPFFNGETLEQSFTKCSRLASETAFAKRIKLLDILIDACDTIAYTHSKGVIHRDLKPANILCGRFGETIILDWGLAQVLVDDDNMYFYREVLEHQRHTLSDNETIQVVGTPAYMAPEQFSGNASKASDVYSLGVMLYRIITGELPYRGILEEITAKIAALPTTPSAGRRNPSAPPELIAICDKATHKNPEERFANASELAEQLKAFREGRMVNVYAYSRQELLRRFLLQNKTLVTMVSLLLIAIISGAGFSIYYANKMELAKKQSDDSLAFVTAVAQQALLEAHAIARSISSGNDRMYADMNQTAEKVAIADDKTTHLLLTQLQNLHPLFEGFTIRNASEITVSNQDDSRQVQPRIINEIENGQLVMVYRVPVPHKDRIVDFLEARLYIKKLPRNYFSLISGLMPQTRHVWIMNNDGLILFDDSPEYIATNLFLNPATAKSPSLQAFGRLMQNDIAGLGYYSITVGNTEIHKVAAWAVVDADAIDSPKVVVSYPYRQVTR